MDTTDTSHESQTFLSPFEAYQFGLLPLVIWFEARNQSLEAMQAVAWVVRNRVASPRWWGWDYPSVILMHYKGVYQFSSFDEDDPNSSKFPRGNSEAWQNCMKAALTVYTLSVPDPTLGATYYFDCTLDSNPPKWSKVAIHTADIGAFHFYREPNP